MKWNRKTNIVFISIFLIFIFYHFGLFTNLGSQITDKLYGGSNTLSDVVIIAIDDSSLQTIGRWPWPRLVFAENLNYLKDAKVIGFDIGFFENSTDDVSFQNSINNLSDKIVLASEYTKYDINDNKIINISILKPVFKSKTGYINVLTDKDSITRSTSNNIGKYNSFAHEIINIYLNKSLSVPDKLNINFKNPHSFNYISFKDIKDYNFTNKIVLIGATSTDLHDNYFVPTSNGKLMPGVEVHANAIQTILLNQSLKKQSTSQILLMIVIISLLIYYLVTKFNLWVAGILSILSYLIIIIMSIFAFNKYYFIINLVYALITILFTFTLLIIYSYFSEEKLKKQIKHAFSKYLSPVVIKELLDNPKKLKLGGEKREITIFFSDIRGFTTLSESLEPEKLVQILNEYFTKMTNICLEEKGLVDKYIGDAIMAFWGAPVLISNHSELAAKASLKMIDELELIQEDLKKRNLPNIDIGIGLNTGCCIVGNLGSNNRFDYTAIGDSVNLASRLEGLTKNYGVKIIISEFTKKELNDKYPTRKLDFVKVKGKKKPVAIYELKKEQSDFDVIYDQGLDLYLISNFKDAIKYFERVNDKASKTMITRCKYYLNNPPPKEWDGSFEMKTK